MQRHQYWRHACLLWKDSPLKTDRILAAVQVGPAASQRGSSWAAVEAVSVSKASRIHPKQAEADCPASS